MAVFSVIILITIVMNLDIIFKTTEQQCAYPEFGPARCKEGKRITPMNDVLFYSVVQNITSKIPDKDIVVNNHLGQFAYWSGKRAHIPFDVNTDAKLLRYMNTTNSSLILLIGTESMSKSLEYSLNISVVEIMSQKSEYYTFRLYRLK